MDQPCTCYLGAGFLFSVDSWVLADKSTDNTFNA